MISTLFYLQYDALVKVNDVFTRELTKQAVSSKLSCTGVPVIQLEENHAVIAGVLSALASEDLACEYSYVSSLAIPQLLSCSKLARHFKLELIDQYFHERAV